MDKQFSVSVLQSTLNPQQLIYAAMRQDYSSDYVARLDLPNEKKCGELIVKHLLAGNRGHYGPLEHPSITFAIGYFPHSVMQQIRTHRVGISIDCQSFRYTGKKIVKLGECYALENPPDYSQELFDMAEMIFYIRPEKIYRGLGNGDKNVTYYYSEKQRRRDLICCINAAALYREKVIFENCPYEQARSLLPFDYRQHWVMSLNVRSLFHILDLRWKRDAQLECQQLCDLLFTHTQNWIPELANWYKENRAHKGVLAP